MRCRFTVYCLLLFLAVLGCRSEPALTLYSGAGLQEVADELAREFEKRHGVHVNCDYSGSEVLLNRLSLAREGDLYMPGDLFYVEMAAEKGLIERQETACYFVPCILVAKTNPKQIASLHDLLEEDVQIGIGYADTCAIGRKTAKLFEKNGIAETDYMRNVVFQSVTVNELGINVELRKLDAAIVWDGVAVNFLDECDVVPIPRNENVISTVPIASLSFSKQPDLAEKFIEFAVSEDGRRIFERQRYTVSLDASDEIVDGDLPR